MAVMRIVARKACSIRTRSSLTAHARQHSHMTDANMMVKAMRKANNSSVAMPISDPTKAAAQPAPNIHLSNLVSGALRTTASTIAPMVPIATVRGTGGRTSGVLSVS